MKDKPLLPKWFIQAMALLASAGNGRDEAAESDVPAGGCCRAGVISLIPTIQLYDRHLLPLESFYRPG